MKDWPYRRLLSDAEGALVSRSVLTVLLASCLLYGKGTLSLLVVLVTVEAAQALGLLYAGAFVDRGLYTQGFALTQKDKVVFVVWGAAAAVAVYVTALVALLFVWSWFRCGDDEQTVLALAGSSCLDLPLGATAVGTFCAGLNLVGAPWYLADIHGVAFGSHRDSSSHLLRWVALQAAAVLQVLHLTLWAFESVATSFLAKVPLLFSAAACGTLLVATCVVLVRLALSADDRQLTKYRAVATTTFAGGIATAAATAVLAWQVTSKFDAIDHVPILVLAAFSLLESLASVVCVLALYTEL
jgi:hypothetical protein